jgi:hypothetical protein
VQAALTTTNEIPSCPLITKITYCTFYDVVCTYNGPKSELEYDHRFTNSNRIFQEKMDKAALDAKKCRKIK